MYVFHLGLQGCSCPFLIFMVTSSSHFSVTFPPPFAHYGQTTEALRFLGFMSLMNHHQFTQTFKQVAPISKTYHMPSKPE
jgi:hypothetical protein